MDARLSIAVLGAAGAIAVSAAAASPAVANQRPEPPRPHIRSDLISFGKERKREMAGYSKRHYGHRAWRLRNPRVIVLHYTTSATYAPAWNTFASNAPGQGRAARELRALHHRQERHHPPRRPARDPLPARDRAQLDVDRDRDGAGAALQLACLRPRDPQPPPPDQRRASPRALAQGAVRHHGQKRDRPRDGQRQPVLQGPRGMAERPHRLGAARRRDLPPPPAAAHPRARGLEDGHRAAALRHERPRPSPGRDPRRRPRRPAHRARGRPDPRRRAGGPEGHPRAARAGAPPARPRAVDGEDRQPGRQSRRPPAERARRRPQPKLLLPLGPLVPGQPLLRRPAPVLRAREPRRPPSRPARQARRLDLVPPALGRGAPRPLPRGETGFSAATRGSRACRSRARAPACAEPRSTGRTVTSAARRWS